MVLLVLATVPAVAGTGRAGAVPATPAQVAPPPSFYLGDGMATPPRPAIYVR